MISLNPSDSDSPPAIRQVEVRALGLDYGLWALAVEVTIEQAGRGWRIGTYGRHGEVGEGVNLKPRSDRGFLGLWTEGGTGHPFPTGVKALPSLNWRKSRSFGKAYFALCLRLHPIDSAHHIQD